MKLLYFSLVLFQIFRIVLNQINFSCPDTYCNNVQCSQDDCLGGRIVKNATKCGCCHICIRPLKVGAKCDTKVFAKIPLEECGPGLRCENRTCVPLNENCAKNQREYDKKYENIELTTAPPRPQCDNFGDFAPVQCKKGRICYCVDKNGNRIFGMAPYWQKDQMHCNCSRDYDEIKDRLEDVTYFLRCEANGNYDNFQCTDDSCYCLNEKEVVSRDNVVEGLKCFIEGKHDRHFSTPCFKLLRSMKQNIANTSKYYDYVIGFDLPECDVDGSFAPVQCKNDKCFCVTKEGDPIKRDPFTGDPINTEVPRYSKQPKHMCRCLREKELLAKSENADQVAEYFKKYKCNKMGSFEPRQCIDSMCYCVNEDGFQKETDESVFVVDQYNLNCTRNS
ncbi:thyroglobulin-like isoform X2 [Centruroides sculpturatus]|uniref:thyroglobulin-like isoform X1 n=1 Tax=Centruroides sculpturatus TaxID=218467 RepID=UPI000C6D6F3F|nr:thyroglobulin-like isoform X1 [Centruroides sculpturatus]XP_023225826.1 thyroglobulin-like isoform X2 [Centruroides sculpturatus]